MPQEEDQATAIGKMHRKFSLLAANLQLDRVKTNNVEPINLKLVLNLNTTIIYDIVL